MDWPWERAIGKNSQNIDYKYYFCRGENAVLLYKIEMECVADTIEVSRYVD